MASHEFCRHYPNRGMMNTHCAVGIEMQSVGDKSVVPYRHPCYDPSIKHLCAAHEHYTEQEIAETDAMIAAFVNGLNAFSSGASRNCPTCGAPVETIDLYEKSEPDMYSLYTQPCNHRHGLWRSAPDWAINEGRVHVIPFGIEDL